MSAPFATPKNRMLYFRTFSESLVELGGMDAAIKTFLEANAKERAATVEVVRMLIPIMDQQLYLNAGYSSLFAFLTHMARDKYASFPSSQRSFITSN